MDFTEVDGQIETLGVINARRAIIGERLHEINIELKPLYKAQLEQNMFREFFEFIIGKLASRREIIKKLNREFNSLVSESERLDNDFRKIHDELVARLVEMRK